MMRLDTRLRVLFVACALVGVVCAPSCRSPRAASIAPPERGSWQHEPIAGVWVTRWDYLTEADIARAMNDIRTLGLTDVFFQVRGQGDAYYRSALEPWGEDLFRAPNDGFAGDPEGPGFDPLEVAIREAHRNGVRLHAWINVMPMWKGTTPPEDQDHPWHAHPEWRLVDTEGEAQALNDHYVIFNPLHPGARDHIVGVARDIVARYPVDGLHLDYIRFVSDTMDRSRFYPGGELARAWAREQTGSDDLSTPGAQDAVRERVRACVTEIVSRIRRETGAARPGVMLTAAVWRRPDIALDQYLQDGAAWLKGGLLDAALPMIYTDDHERYASDRAAWAGAAPGGRVLPGIGVYKHADRATARAQVDAAPEGFVLFAYSSLFVSRANGHENTMRDRAERAARHGAVREALGGARP